VPVLGITGTGGAGKSSLTDELLSRLLRDHPERTSRWCRSTRRGGAPAGRCSAIASA
jgi:DNA-binding transcriptional regulator YdaS (Cro superfamily)